MDLGLSKRLLVDIEHFFMWCGDNHDDDANESEENDEHSNHAHYHLERCSFP